MKQALTGKLELELELGLPALRTVRSTCLLFKPPASGILRWQPKLATTSPHLPGCRKAREAAIVQTPTWCHMARGRGCLVTCPQ